MPEPANPPEAAEPTAGGSAAPLSPTPRTKLRRYPERGRTERSELYHILDAGLFCHLGVVDQVGPRVIPTLYGRVGDTVYIHGSPASATLRAAQGEAPVCLTVTLIQGLVLARSVFHHSMNFRCAMVYGHLRVVTDPDERLAGLRAAAEQLVPGRWAAARAPSREELARTAIFALSLNEASVKIREGGPHDADEDLALEVWAGVLPLESRWGVPEPDSSLTHGISVPEHISRLAGRAAFEPRAERRES
jgi:nitroimidazol reductase NimA-like FMN-containing flavoprotein (pyridoxamine 5'-phosphate oxidase superfamily)